MASTPYPESNSEQQAKAPTTEHAVAAAHRSIDALGDRASQRESSLRETAASTAERYSERQQHLRSQVNGNMERARGYVRENPLISAGAAFAAGALLTTLFGGRR